MKKQTAVEWLIQNIVADQTIKAKSMSEWTMVYAQAKAMEKEQTEENIAKAITFGWELSHYHRDKESEVLLQMQKDFITSVIEGGKK